MSTLIPSNIPEVNLYFRTLNPESDKYEWDIKNSIDIFKDKKILLFSLPGAFTPKCTTLELPAYEENYDKFVQEHGFDDVYCISVNDAFVMNMWAKNMSINQVKMIPDGNASFTKSMNMLVDKENLGFGKRSWRYTAIVNNCVIEKSFVECGMHHNSKDDPYQVTNPQNILDFLKI